MCDIPVEVTDPEKIIRAVVSPFHIDQKKNRLRKAAFRSKPGTDEVSVIRATYKDADFCKSKGREAAGEKEYVGLAVLTASQIRRAGSEVHDSRSEYCGHAHISHGIIERPHEPLPPELNTRLETLRDCAIFYLDPQPQTSGWNGPAL